MGFLHSRLHARIVVTVAVLDRLVEAGDRQFRLAVEFFEGRRLDRYVAWHAFEFKGLYYALWRLYLAIFAPESVVIAVRPTRDESPSAARTKVHLTGEHCHTSGPPPARHVLGPGDGFEDEFARSVED